MMTKGIRIPDQDPRNPRGSRNAPSRDQSKHEVRMTIAGVRAALSALTDGDRLMSDDAVTTIDSCVMRLTHARTIIEKERRA